MNDKIIIDCQILQTAAFDRGMGKYTSSVLRAFSQECNELKTYNQVIILLNKNIKTDSTRKQYIQALIPKSKLVFLDLPVSIDSDTIQKNIHARRVITDFCAEHGEKTELSFLITAPFFVGFASVFPDIDKVKKFSLVYDFIPYRIWHKQRIFPDDLYFQHFNMLMDADHLFTISTFVKNDLINIFGFREEKITAIDGGPFKQQLANVSSMRPIKEKYIIYPSAPIVHKNNDIAVKGFKKFNKRNDNLYKLVFTSSFDENTKDRLNKISKDLIFTGNITDEELSAYYSNAETVLFASLSEGLGMPVLEAMQYGLPVACSDIPVLTEISDSATYLFKPNSPSSIAASLQKAVKKENFNEKLADYKSILGRYSWERSARLMLEGIIKATPNIQQKENLVIVTKKSTENSKESRFIEYIYAELTLRFNISVMFTESKRKLLRKESPSFVYYVANNIDVLNTDKILCIGKVSKQLLKKRASNKKIFINILGVNKKRVAKSIITIIARRRPVDKYLGFYDWEYKIGGKNVKPKHLVEEIIKGFDK